MLSGFCPSMKFAFTPLADGLVYDIVPHARRPHDDFTFVPGNDWDPVWTGKLLGKIEQMLITKEGGLHLSVGPVAGMHAAKAQFLFNGQMKRVLGAIEVHQRGADTWEFHPTPLTYSAAALSMKISKEALGNPLTVGHSYAFDVSLQAKDISATYTPRYAYKLYVMSYGCTETWDMGTEIEEATFGWSSD